MALRTGVTTFAHQLHAALVLKYDGANMHLVWNEAVLITLMIATMLWFVRKQKRYVLWVYFAIAVLRIIGLGLYEGG